MFCPLGIILPGLIKIASGMSPAGKMNYSFFLPIFIIDAIAICLKIASKIFEHIHRCLLPTGRLVVKDYISIDRAMIYPIVAQMSFSFFWPHPLLLWWSRLLGGSPGILHLLLILHIAGRFSRVPWYTSH